MGRPKRIVILGGGTGGTLVANRLRRMFSTMDVAITVVDQDDRHVYQPGLLFVPFGLTHAEAHRASAAPPAPRRHRVLRVGHRPGRHRGERGAPHRRHDSRLRRADRRDGRDARPRGDRGTHRPGLDGEGVHLLHARGCGRLQPALATFDWRPSSSSTSSTCRSSARWLRSSSASSPTGTSANAASATRSS